MANATRNQLLTSGEVAWILQVNVNTIRRWCDRGMIEHYRIGTRGDRRIPLSFIDSLISQVRDRITTIVPAFCDNDSKVPSYIREYQAG